MKVAVSALVVAGASELAKRHPLAGAILAALPLVSILALIWLFAETRDVGKVCSFSNGILWALIPSVILYLVLPPLLKGGVRFVYALPVSCLAMVLGYGGYVLILRKFGVEL
ncbi:MAG: DUF3147 family protein [Elusimicrobiota bacterium]